MPVASPAQYICNMLEDLDQDNLQPPLVVDPRPAEAYSDCQSGYGQQTFDIEDFITEPIPYDHSRRQCRVSEYSSGYVNFIQNARQIDYSLDRSEYPPVSYSGSNNNNNNNNNDTNNENIQRIPELISTGYASSDEPLRCEAGGPVSKNLYAQHQHNLQQHEREYSAYHNLERKEKISKTSEMEFQQWSNKHPETWNTKEVLDWIFYSAERNHLDCGLLRAENFRSITGADLCKMGLEDFKRLEQNYGKLFYDLFRSICDTPFTQPSHVSGHRMDIEDMTSSNHPHRHPPIHMNSDPGPLEHYSTPEYCKRDIKSEPNSDGVYYDLQHIPSPYDCRPLSQPHYLPSAQHPMSSPIQSCGNFANPFMYSDYSNPHHMAARQCHIPEEVIPTQIPRRRPGRPRIKSLPTDEEAQREKKAKNQHLWEFIYEILMNPLYNPQFVRWENQREGVFRFVQSEAVAQLWGGLKNNENMTYEKLSRAMRHYYKRGILERVEGRRLVYKFSRIAMDRVREKRYSV